MHLLILFTLGVSLLYTFPNTKTPSPINYNNEYINIISACGDGYSLPINKGGN